MSFLDLEGGSYQAKDVGRSQHSWGRPTGYGSTEVGTAPSPSLEQTHRNQDGEFARVHKTVFKDIEDLSRNVSRIQKMLSQVGTSKDSHELRDNIRSNIGRTRQLVKDTNQGVKLLGQLCDTPNATEKTRRKKIQAKLTKDFQTWLGRFQEVTKQSARKEREVAVPAPSSSTAETGFYGDDLNESEQASLLTAQNRQMDDLMHLEADREFNDSLITEREEGIREIESTVMEVNEIFQDLSTLVVEQGTLIDSIENHIEEASHQVTAGVHELRQASEHQRKARTKMCCMILVIIAVIIAAILVVVLAIKL